MKEKNKKIKLIIVVVAFILLALEGYFVYGHTNKKLKELQGNLDNLSNEIFNIHSKNVDIMYRLNIDMNGDNLVASYDDELYSSYEYDVDNPFCFVGYHVYDKKKSSYVKTGLTGDAIINFFDKIGDEYYYIVLSTVDNHPHSDIYKVDGTLVSSVEGVYDSYNLVNKKITFVDRTGEEEKTYTWSPDE